jgi:cytochrome c oxidase subunit 1/cytochrome c oxidase subunit I+III
MLLLGVNIVWSLCRGKRAADNPWDAWTLEWATTSPPPENNFERVPPIRGRRPLWDLAHPDRPDSKDAAVRPTGDFAPEKNKASMIVFIISEGFFFLLLIIAYLYYNYTLGSGPTASGSLDVGRTGLFTICLLASSVTLWRAERGFQRRDRAAMRRWLVVTILLGAVFLLGQAREYWELFRHGIQVNTNLFASSFFTLTGFHGLHVCIGLIGLLIVLGLIWRGRAQDFQSPALETLGLYWHFVDGVWIVVFTVVYLRLLS